LCPVGPLRSSAISSSRSQSRKRGQGHVWRPRAPRVRFELESGRTMRSNLHFAGGGRRTYRRAPSKCRSSSHQLCNSLMKNGRWLVSALGASRLSVRSRADPHSDRSARKPRHAHVGQAAQRSREESDQNPGSRTGAATQRMVRPTASDRFALPFARLRFLPNLLVAEALNVYL
jgi:hypothetical protein